MKNYNKKEVAKKILKDLKNDVKSAREALDSLDKRISALEIEDNEMTEEEAMKEMEKIRKTKGSNDTNYLYRVTWITINCHGPREWNEPYLLCAGSPEEAKKKAWERYKENKKKTD